MDPFWPEGNPPPVSFQTQLSPAALLLHLSIHFTSTLGSQILSFLQTPPECWTPVSRQPHNGTKQDLGGWGRITHRRLELTVGLPAHPSVRLRWGSTAEQDISWGPVFLRLPAGFTVRCLMFYSRIIYRLCFIHFYFHFLFSFHFIVCLFLIPGQSTNKKYVLNKEKKSSVPEWGFKSQLSSEII